MERVYNMNEGLVKSWISDDEFYARDRNGNQKIFQQTLDALRMPHLFRHFALMPDAHVGFGVPNGSVLVLDGAISPGAVGVDIGCGMNAVKTDIPYEVIQEHQVQLCRDVKKCVPVGEGGKDGSHWLPTDNIISNLPSIPSIDFILASKRIQTAYMSQIGSLGGGNHFIEFDRDEDGNTWVVVHCGSRGVGHEIATHYMKKSHEMASTWGHNVHRELGFFPTDTPEGQEYIAAMDFALHWAMANRMLIMNDIVATLMNYFGATNVHVDDHINVHHNYASLENHFNRNVWVHRKGATRARDGHLLVIPGNMGDGTAICRGLSNFDSFHSCSHGAGRKMGRKEACQNITYEEQQAYLAERGVYLCAGTDRAIDESPQAYKNFDDVLAAQADLIEVEYRLYPVAVIKG